MIASEAAYMRTKQKVTRLEEERLQVLRSKANTLSDVMFAEVRLRDVDERIVKLNAKLAEYDMAYHSGRVGGWYPTQSGRRFWPEDPRPQDIDIRDIAYALARINRFNGHSKKCYSVAQHSVLVSSILHPSVALFGLMHDAAEAYLGDIITPVKRLFRASYEAIEHRVMVAIGERYGFGHQLLMPSCVEAVKWADLTLLATEIRDLTRSQIAAHPLPELPLNSKIVKCWSPREATRRFLQAFEKLDGSQVM